MKIVEKPWGRELWIAHTDQYALKIIEFKKGSRSSLQYHVKKHEHVYVDSGLLQVELETEQGTMETMTLKPGDVIENKPGRKHRVTALEDVRLIEVSTPELDDVVRVEDDYHRIEKSSNG
jgi:mannose-6-phosphate isomerase